MKVFISWSGERSRLVAELLSSWLKCVIQAVEPWISSKDIDRGALWFTQISESLAETTVGVICLTHDNLNKPWILFESGALAKGLSSSRVCTFLIDLIPNDIEDPLAQFNHTLPDREGVLKLLHTINRSLEANRLRESVLQEVFETFWPKFESEFNQIIQKTPAEKPPVKRDEGDLLSDILTIVRNIDRNQRAQKTVDLKATPSFSKDDVARITNDILLSATRLKNMGYSKHDAYNELIQRGHPTFIVERAIPSAFDSPEQTS